MDDRRGDRDAPRRIWFRNLVTGLVIVLGLLTIISVAVGRLASAGVDVALTVGLLLVAVGLVILLIDVFGVAGSGGNQLFLTGLSLALGGMIYAWTGVLWFAVVALLPPFVFRAGNR